MKKFFAVLSVLALIFAVVGLSGKTAHADASFTEDPTIGDNEIPVYIMGSIYSTFPNYYDYAAAGDDAWQGSARMYPWNETRLQVKQIADGAFTGKEYAFFFAGSLDANSTGTAANIGVWAKDASGNYVAGRIDTGASSGKYYYTDGTTSTLAEGIDSSKTLLYDFALNLNTGAADPSLSHMRVNLLDEDIVIDDLSGWGALSGDQGKNFYNRAIIFDGQGRAVWGNSIDQAYAGSTSYDSENGFTPEFCYVDGVVTKIADGVVCDKVEKDIVDEETGEIIGTEKTDEDKYYSGRFIWKWVEADEYDASLVNADGYMQGNWDPDKWDYAYEKDGGYMYIGLVHGAANGIYLNAEEVAFLEAAGKTGYTTSSTRKALIEITIPANGVSFDFGYLDKMNDDSCAKFIQVSVQAYENGRLVDEDGKGMAYYNTYNFSAKPAYQVDKVVDGYSQRLDTQNNIIEVLQGTTIQPAANIVYTGLARYWSVEGDITSFKADTSVLDKYLVVNGKTEVSPVIYGGSMDNLIADFVADWNAYCDETFGENAASHYISADIFDNEKTNEEIVNEFYTPLGWDFAGTGASDTSFVAKNWDKWGWMLELIITACEENGVATVNWKSNGAVTSPGSSRDALWGFLAGSPVRSISGTYANTCADFSDGKNMSWAAGVDFDTYSFVADGDVDSKYVVEYKINNTDSGTSSAMTLTFVVVDEYTPIIEVNDVSNLIFVPTVADSGKISYPTIDTTKFVTAYNGAYNGTSINGNEITHKVHFVSDLDFNNPEQGEFEVEAIVYNDKKYATVKFTVSIEDVEAPEAAVKENIQLCVGASYNPYDYIYYAIDNVEGNLLDCGDPSLVVVSGNVKTQTPGTYTVKYEFYDCAGNSVACQSKVTVLEPIDNSEDIAALQDTIDDLAEQVEDLQAKLEEVQTTLTESGCNSAAVIVELLAAASLVFVFLKKRH